LSADPNLLPEEEAAYYNLWVAAAFGLEGNLDLNAPFGPPPTNITLIQPANLYDGEPRAGLTLEATYALALAGLSQEAVDRGLSPVEWLAQLAADADDDGLLNGAAESSAQELEAATLKFLAGPRNPLFADDMPDMPGGATRTSPNNINLRYFINLNGDEDWFQFHLDQAGSSQVHLTSLPTNYDLYVYNPAGELLGSSAKKKKAAELVMLTNAAPGDYYVRVVGVDGSHDADNPYQLRFNLPGTGGP
jgi:hypothetical protein